MALSDKWGMCCLMSTRSRKAGSCHQGPAVSIAACDSTRARRWMLANAVTKLLVQTTTTFEWLFKRSNPVSSAFTARTASNGSLLLSARSLRAASVSTSSIRTQKKVSPSSSSSVSMFSNVLFTNFPLSLKNLLPRAWALISINLLSG